MVILRNDAIDTVEKYKSEKGFSIKRLAMCSGVAPAQLSTILNRKRQMRDLFAAKLAYTLNIPFEEIFEYDKDNMSIGDNLKLSRLKLRMSQKDVSDYIGVCQRMISDIETGFRFVTPNSVNKVLAGMRMLEYEKLTHIIDSNHLVIK